MTAIEDDLKSFTVDKNKEDKLVEELHKKVKEAKWELNTEIFDDWTMRRYLRARNHDITKATDMILKSLQWRKDNRVDTILDWCPKENKNFWNLRRYWPGNFHGVDKLGIPVMYNLAGAADLAVLMTWFPFDDLLNYIIYCQEEGLKLKRDLSKKHHKNYYAGLTITDLGGITVKQVSSKAAVQLYSSLISINEQHYPETLRVNISVNCPKLASVAYKLVKPFIESRTQKKIFFLGAKVSAEDTQFRLQHVDKDQLPSDYGGECKCEGGCILGGGEYVDEKEDGTNWNFRKISLKQNDKSHSFTLKVKHFANLHYNFKILNPQGNPLTLTIVNDKNENVVEPIECTKLNEDVKGKLKKLKKGEYKVTWTRQNEKGKFSFTFWVGVHYRNFKWVDERHRFNPPSKHKDYVYQVKKSKGKSKKGK